MFGIEQKLMLVLENHPELTQQYLLEVVKRVWHVLPSETLLPLDLNR